MKGKRYFKCEANKGMFILAKEIQRKLSPDDMIQKLKKVNECISNHSQAFQIRHISKHMPS